MTIQLGPMILYSLILLLEGGAVPDFIAQKLGSARFELVIFGATVPDFVLIPNGPPDHTILQKALILHRNMSELLF